MRISKIYSLGKSQFELDFIDIDVNKDIPLFIDPYFLSIRKDKWSVDASRTLKSFFETFIQLIRRGKDDDARLLFSFLHEPNETRLGLSRGKPRGNGMGDVDADKLFHSIKTSKAVNSGLVEDLEDFKFFIPGIGKDKISDMSTNIIRRHLLDYTKQQCLLWNIPLTKNINVGHWWDRRIRKWVTNYDESLVVNDKLTLLVPKGIVSFCKHTTSDKYFNKFVLEFLQNEHIRMGSVFVKHREDGSPYVTKKDLKEKAVTYSKEYLLEFSEKHPEVFRDYKDWIKKNTISIDNEEIDDNLNRIQVVDYLLDKLSNTLPGPEKASEYHRLIVGILELLLYPNISAPSVEHEVNSGRKRIDILFENSAENGFFYNLHMIHKISCPYIFVECKNYRNDVKNPELDQLSGRFSPNKGRFGLLLCREINDDKLFLDRCADTLKDDRGLIIPLTDSDLISALKKYKVGEQKNLEDILNKKMKIITFK
ncbi:hypothetical protein HV357_21695 [Enterobacter cloacae]|uniref:hypothetical protein n=1 Tax=Enterobacter cloacae TaxID=550 RepID=UPI0015F8773A|nr:hypothetical protein [Enterobacter cloacae]MBA7853115.1 hypothetical protein [Enterobacter cloacae]